MSEHQQEQLQTPTLFRCASISDRALERVYHMLKVVSAQRLLYAVEVLYH